MTLVPVDLAGCPTCGGPTFAHTATQPALIRHGGDGAAIRTTTVICRDAACAWWLVTDRSAQKP